jgi:hypothetical protein
MSYQIIQKKNHNKIVGLIAQPAGIDQRRMPRVTGAKIQANNYKLPVDFIILAGLSYMFDCWNDTCARFTVFLYAFCR